MIFNPTEHPHRRYNPLTGEWVVVSPHRLKRPWLGKIEALPPDNRPAYDPNCYLCPGNTRAGGIVNPNYTDTFVFDNDFAAILASAPEPPVKHPLMRVGQILGKARVMCFSPRHDLTLSEMELPAIRRVVDMWAGQVEDLGQQYRWVQLFENRGAMMGSSNPHPHGQVWGTAFLPTEAAREDELQRAYFDEYGRPMLMDYVALEQKQPDRIIAENEHWLAVVPYWAKWPYEALLLPKAHVRRMTELDDGQRDSLADALKQLLICYDNLFNVSFPYSMGWHGAPNDDADYRHWQLHAHFYPPLLRSATVKKFMVGFEMLGEPQRDLTAEQAAARLQALPKVHYKQSA